MSEGGACWDCQAGPLDFDGLVKHRWGAHRKEAVDTAEGWRARGWPRVEPPERTTPCGRCGLPVGQGRFRAHARVCPGPVPSPPTPEPQEAPMPRPCGDCGKVGHGRKDCPKTPAANPEKPAKATRKAPVRSKVATPAGLTPERLDQLLAKAQAQVAALQLVRELMTAGRD